MSLLSSVSLGCIRVDRGSSGYQSLVPVKFKRLRFHLMRLVKGPRTIEGTHSHQLPGVMAGVRNMMMMMMMTMTMMMMMMMMMMMVVVVVVVVVMVVMMMVMVMLMMLKLMMLSSSLCHLSFVEFQLINQSINQSSNPSAVPQSTKPSINPSVNLK